jgi:hypothetical protein
MRAQKAKHLVTLAALFAIGLGGVAVAQSEVPRIVVRNPIMGFSLTIPADWDMGTGVLGETVITINARTPSPSAPLLSFFYMPSSPKEGAGQIAEFLKAVGQALGVNIAPQVRATDKADEWEVTMTADVALIGSVSGRWLCRRQGGTTYAIGMIAATPVAEKFKEDIDTAFATCHLIDRPAVHYFREPTENAYRLVLPDGWKWEGSIYRDVNCPGWFVMKVQSADGLIGHFESPPVAAMTEYIGAQNLAENLLLQQLRKEVPDLELENVQVMPRASDDLASAIETATGNAAKVRAERAFADYVGTANAKRIRIRMDISLYFTPLLFGGGNETMWFCGSWAPVDNFDELYPLARGVEASLWETPQWRKSVRETVRAVLKGRAGAMEESAEGWDRYMREVELVHDPAGGDPQEVPYGPGWVWKDNDGKMHRVPEQQALESELSRRGWKPLERN